MIESPYRDIENPPEERFLQRMEEIFLGEKNKYALKYIATNSYGFGHITRKKEGINGKNEQNNEEIDTYAIVIGDSREPLTIEITKAPHGILSLDSKDGKVQAKK